VPEESKVRRHILTAWDKTDPQTDHFQDITNKSSPRTPRGAGLSLGQKRKKGGLKFTVKGGGVTRMGKSRDQETVYVGVREAQRDSKRWPKRLTCEGRRKFLT